MILHIVFGQSSVTNLKAAFELDPQLEGRFYVTRMIWPLGRSSSSTRQTVARHVKTGGTPCRTLPCRRRRKGRPSPPEDPVRSLKARLREEEELIIWIWAGQNPTDVCGYYWLVSQLDRYSGRIHLIYLNNLPFLNEKNGVFYPTHLHQILPKEYLKAKKLAREVSLAEFELDGDEWRRLMNENAGVRLLEGGKKIRGKGSLIMIKTCWPLSERNSRKPAKRHPP